MSRDKMSRDDCTAMVQAAYRDGIKHGRENRWAAFSYHELEDLRWAVGHPIARTMKTNLFEEVHAELARRKDA